MAGRWPPSRVPLCNSLQLSRWPRFFWPHGDSPRGSISHVLLLADNTSSRSLRNHRSPSHGHKRWFFKLQFRCFRCKILVCLIYYFFFLLSFIHELKWLWAVTNQFFTALWTDGCSKNTSSLAVSNRPDLPKQHCRHFIKSKEIKTHLHISIFFSVIKTQPVAVGSAGTHCPPGKPEFGLREGKTSCWSCAVLVVHTQAQHHISPTLEEQKEGGTWCDPTSPTFQLVLL